MNNEACVRDIEGLLYAGLDAAGTRPVSIGGDHSITGPILKAIAGPGRRLSGGRPVSLVHFDAHTDSYENMPHWLGARRSAAHWAAYTARESAVDPAASIQLGSAVILVLRVIFLRWGGAVGVSRELGYQVVTMAEFEELGVARTAEAPIRSRVGDNPVYITFDLDSLDPSRGARRLQHRARLLRIFSRSARRRGSSRRWSGST